MSSHNNPDITLLTGDYITDQPNTIDELTNNFEYLKNCMGIHAVLDSHNYCHHQAKSLLTKALTSIGIIAVWNNIDPR
ncbi:hypothetical protein [cyanobacterium endosymbiont of Rhopalodia gibberula]|uniref:hypothetical protein n=1 Tax=cyanobacterium endosymbiont of Rhopalodia gibberula TaxID=1763363 RepID=UPI001E5DF06A|nr:hypothetical protein [cyanobacterium endosymbiont of Rhopalodia gibberula]